MASRIASRYLTSILRTLTIISPPLLRPHPHLLRTLQPTGVGHRFAHAIPKPTRPDRGASSSPDATKKRKQLEPHYQLAFTCVPCGHRSSHTVSKQGYHHGSVLISCPSCRRRHVISDNLNIFGDRKITVEDLLREKGQLVKRGTLGEDDDIEFWEDTLAESADGASLGEGEEHDAKRLRETRDPVSSATDTVPLTSVLPGDAGTRPSISHVSHQSPTPSTRRQYQTKQLKTGRKKPTRRKSRTKQLKTGRKKPTHQQYQTKQFTPPPGLKRGRKKPVGWIKSSSKSGASDLGYRPPNSGIVWVTLPRDTTGINNKDLDAGVSRDFKVTRDASVTTVLATAESFTEVKSENPSSTLSESETPLSQPPWAQESMGGMGREAKTQLQDQDFKGVRRIEGPERQAMQIPQVRRVLARHHYNGPRLVGIGGPQKFVQGREPPQHGFKRP
ncbi:DNL zinc finger-domain-containing protein [Xylaria telfairii]|nr:DNL zinc finger-domain-containing protein [Xylaria telfairii]